MWESLQNLAALPADVTCLGTAQTNTSRSRTPSRVWAPTSAISHTATCLGRDPLLAQTPGLKEHPHIRWLHCRAPSVGPTLTACQRSAG